MQQSREAHGLIARAANRHLGKADRETAGVLSTAQRHTHFLDSPRMGSVLSRSDFADLKHRTTTIFLVLPPDRLETYARWLRLMLTSGITAMAREAQQPREPVLFLLDEFASLGQLPAIERAAALQSRTVTDFVLSSVQEAARRTIEEHQRLDLSVRDSAAFVEALLNPRPVNDRLRDTVNRYRQKTGN